MKLYRSIATVSGFTAISRLLGFVRDMLIAAVLGAGLVADAFFVAFRLPNLFRSLFAEGAFNSAFVPLFTKRLKEDGMETARRFAEEALAVLLFALLFVTIAAEIAMPWLVSFIAPGFADNPEKFDLAVLLTRITFPYLFCMSLTALSAGLLNAMGRFAAAAAAPILLNVITIGAMILAASFHLYNQPEAAMILAWAVTVAGFTQLALLAIMARRQGMDLGFRIPRLTPGVRRLFTLAGPGVVTAGITQINLFIGTMIASLAEGAVSYLYYADRINQLPLGIVGIAIGVVLLPELSQKLAADNPGSAMHSHNRALEFALLLTLPAAAALVIWSHASASSKPILSAARSALARRVLVPVALGKTPPPPSFEHLWPMDLAGWNGRPDDPRWKFVLDELELATRRGVVFRPAAANDRGEP
ncbi:MAG: murein biosynthesis integral membrane protein MurJ, partial [Rhodomicrobium sp.]|nr:murein biosynthesis integral membrane protein MurJ [Rhodomicrobium sp.]